MSLIEALERIKYAKKAKASFLDLSFLELKEIPSEISNLTQLKILNLRNNQLTELKGLETLTKLTELYLRSNPLTQLNGIETLTKLTRLDLSSNQLRQLKGLEALTQLTRLDLYSNQLTELKEIETLTQLTELDLSDNKLAELKGLETLTQLSHLNLSRNQLLELKGLEKLTQLTSLDLSGNILIELKGIETLTQLTSLDLSGNLLTELKGLETITQLTELDLSDNQIMELNELENLIQLTTLYLSNNKLTELPEFLLKMNQPIVWDPVRRILNGFYVEGNPFTIPPPEIIQNGNEAIREYFEQLRMSGKEQINEAKLILLGDGRSGKTSLANRLLNKELPQEEDRTQGVDIEIGGYTFKLANGVDFKINIWDFAGQDKYKTVHQLFYTDSSLYVMVAESGNTTTDYDDWFQTAELFGDGSPLVLVLNEFRKGIGMGSFDSSYWKKRFPELLKEVVTVNLKTKENIQVAEQYIQFLAQNLPHTQYSFPSNWAAIRRALNERRQEQFITLNEYFELCKKNNIPDRESALILSAVLHQVGDCLHYQKNDLLKQHIILKNEWATDAVYKILEDRIVAESNRGFFDRTDVARIWNSPEYSGMRPQLLELMKLFKLAYQLPLKEEFVTPPLLPPARPADFEWPAEPSLELYIEYEFLPKALLTQFIVILHTDIARDRTLVWRHGVVLQWENEALAEVSKTRLAGKEAFYIRTQGKNRKGMMTVILKTFRELHKDYKGIKCKEKVPCTCNGCKTKKNEQHYFDFSSLQLRLEKGREEVDCEKSVETLNLRELLENSFEFEKRGDNNTLQLKEHVSKGSTPAIRTLRLFLASSNELSNERDRIEQALARKNKSLQKEGIIIELLIWEDSLNIGKSIRSQDNYNLAIATCDLFAMLFYSKVGKYSLEEFNLAVSLFEEKGLPRISIFQKDQDLPKNQSKADADSRFIFLEHLKELEHFPHEFKNTDQLIRQLEDTIDKLLMDESFLSQFGKHN